MLWHELYLDGKEVLVTTSVCGKMQQIADYSQELLPILAWTYALDGYLDFFEEHGTHSYGYLWPFCEPIREFFRIVKNLPESIDRSKIM